MHQRIALLAVMVTTFVQPARLVAQEHDHHHQIGQLGRVVFPVSCTPRPGSASSTRWPCSTRSGGRRATAPSARCWRPTPAAPWPTGARRSTPGAIRSPAGPTGAALAPGSRSRAACFGAPGRDRTGARIHRGNRGSLPQCRLHAQLGAAPGYADSMARLYRGLPKDVEVAIYYALAKWRRRHAPTPPSRNRSRAIAILDPLFAQHPDHPGLAHYVIHATDSPGSPSWGWMRPGVMRRSPRPRPTLSTCRRTSSSASDSGTRPSRRTGSRIRRAMSTPRRWGCRGTMEELHALDYAVYGYLQRGQDSAARAAVTRASGEAQTSSASG